MHVDRGSAEVWASWFRCLGDASRVLILNRLAVARRPMSVGEVVEAVDIGQPTVSHHLKILDEVGFVLVEQRANSRLYRVNEHCLGMFPSAADVVMGQLPRYGSVATECRAPWQQTGEPGDNESVTTRGGDRVTDDALVETLQAHYGAAARRAAQGEAAARDRGEPSAAAAANFAPAVDACCGRDGEAQPTVFGSGLYGADELAQLPAEAVAGSIGCANPVALAQLAEGEVVLDLGSGGGIDVLLSARRVGPTGTAYGVDMTPEMLELARANQLRAGVENVEFLEGRIEAVPLPDASVDVVVSNCVINLSADKGAVFAEAYRVLRPGGRLAIADVIADVEPDAALRSDREAWASCIAGAVTRAQYTATLTGAGFLDVEVTDSHEVQDGFWSALVRATKP